MSSKIRNMDWPPERTVIVGGILGRYQKSEIMEISTEISNRVKPKEQQDGRGI